MVTCVLDGAGVWLFSRYFKKYCFDIQIILVIRAYSLFKKNTISRLHPHAMYLFTALLDSEAGKVQHTAVLTKHVGVRVRLETK